MVAEIKKKDRKQKGPRQEAPSRDREQDRGLNFVEEVICVRRVAKVIKGGRRLTFSAFVVVGDGAGRVGVALGKGREVAPAVSKAFKRARKNMITVPLYDATLPYGVEAKFGASRVVLRSASKGTGVIAGGAVRAIMGAAGVKNVLSKSLGSSNSITVAYAVMRAFSMLKSAQQISRLRGLSVTEMLGGAQNVG